MHPEAEFHVLNLSPKRGKPKLYCNPQLPQLYASERPVTKEKYKGIMDLNTTRYASDSSRIF